MILQNETTDRLRMLTPFVLTHINKADRIAETLGMILDFVPVNKLVIDNMNKVYPC